MKKTTLPAAIVCFALALVCMFTTLAVNGQTPLTQFTLLTTNIAASVGTDLGCTAINVTGMDHITIFTYGRGLDTSNGAVNITVAKSLDNSRWTLGDGEFYVPMQMYGSNFVCTARRFDITGYNYIKLSVASNSIAAGVSNIAAWYGDAQVTKRN